MNNKLVLFNQEAHLNEEGIACYAEFLLNRNIEPLSEEVLQHMMECELCKQSCLELIEILQQEPSIIYADNLKDIKKPPGTGKEDLNIQLQKKDKNVIGFQVLKVAAAIVLLIGMGWILMYWIKMKNEGSVYVKKDVKSVMTDSLNKQQGLTSIQSWVSRWADMDPECRLAFQPDNMLEGMLKLVFRTDDFTVLTPDSIAEISYGKVLIFNWDDKIGKEIILRLLDNKGKLVHQRRLEHHVSYEIKKLLEPGMYYWFIEQSNYTIAGGRIGVIRNQ